MKLKRVLLIAVAVVVGLPVLLVLAVLGLYEWSDRRSGTLVVAGETREYLLHVPASYEGAHPTPLVVSLHGSGLWPSVQMAMTGWNEVADEEGFIVVYPGGAPMLGGHWAKMWRLWSGLTGGRDVTAEEVRFVSDLIDALGARYSIDATRIYVDGYSGGGGMVNLLACRLPDRFAAMGAVAAARLSWETCDGFKPTPLMAFQGTADAMGPFEGGPSTHWAAPPGATWDSVADWIGGWAQRNGCTARPIEASVATDVVRLEYAACESGAEVVLYTIEGGGHTWPGAPHPALESIAGHTSYGVDATRELWTFFRAHRRRESN